MIKLTFYSLKYSLKFNLGIWFEKIVYNNNKCIISKQFKKKIHPNGISGNAVKSKISHRSLELNKNCNYFVKKKLKSK